MSEKEVVEMTNAPITKKDLIFDLKKMGVKKGDCLLVHTSLSKVGWVCGGPTALVEALLESVGDGGTVMMPTHTTGNTEPRNWQNPAVPESWWQVIREEMPAFDLSKTPTVAMGVVSEAFRMWPGTLRSPHPIGSFAANGQHAEMLLVQHSLEPMFGDQSPLGRLYELGGKVLLIGVGHDSNTSLHLAEYLADFNKTYLQEGCAMVVEGKRQWVQFETLALDSGDFEKIGGEFKNDKPGIGGTIGFAKSLLFQQREMVDFAVDWMNINRSGNKTKES